LWVAANDTEIGDQLAFARRGYAGPGLLDDTHEIVAWRKRQRPFEVRVSAATDEGISEAGAGGEYLDTDLARTGVRNSLLSCQFQDLGTAEPSDTDVLPRHALTVVVIVTGVMRHVAAALNGSLRECCIRLDLTRSPSRGQ
jgi:hypothetical protein